MERKNFFISTAIDYPSSRPHMGHAYEKICADVIARYKRLKGFRVHFSTGTDEHGMKIQRNAEKSGKKPRQFVDGMVVFFRDLCRKLDMRLRDIKDAGTFDSKASTKRARNQANAKKG